MPIVAPTVSMGDGDDRRLLSARTLWETTDGGRTDGWPFRSESRSSGTAGDIRCSGCCVSKQKRVKVKHLFTYDLERTSEQFLLQIWEKDVDSFPGDLPQVSVARFGIVKYAGRVHHQKHVFQTFRNGLALHTQRG